MGIPFNSLSYSTKKSLIAWERMLAKCMRSRFYLIIMNKLLKKISIIFACLGLCALLSLPCILSIDRKAEQTSAVDSDSSVNDLIKFDKPENSVEAYEEFEADLCYLVNFQSSNIPAINFSISPLYFEYYGQVFMPTSNVSLELNHSNRGITNLLILSGNVRVLDLTINNNFYVVFSADVSASTYGFHSNTGKIIYQANYSIYSSIVSEINSLEGAIVALQSQKDILQGQITSLNSDLATAQSNITSLQLQIAALNFDKQELQSQITLLDYQISAKEGLIDELQAERDELESQIEDLESQIEELEDDVYYWNSEYTTAHNSLLELQHSVSSLTTTIDNLRASLSAREEEIETLSAANGVFGLIRSAFTGIIPLLDYQLAPNLSIGAILTIPFVLAILGFILKAVS